jgi:peptide deformylase
VPVRPILQLGNPLLRRPCEAVSDPRAADVRDLVADLADTVAHARATTGYGRAIAAPQIGALRRVVVLRLPGRPVWPLVNPEIVARSAETMTVWDACLSFLCIFMQVERHRTIAVRYQDLDGATHVVEAGDADDLSELLQHEIDHLDGVLCLDRVTDLTTICTREEFERRHRAGSPYADAGRASI